MSITKIAELGDDALANLWDMTFGPIPFISDVTTTTLRIQNFSIPPSGANTYEVHYKTQMFTKPSGKVDAPNEFSFDFRVDRNWIIYKAFVAWKNAVANSYSGDIGFDGAATPNRIPITVWAVDGDGSRPTGLGVWTFEGCYVTNISEISLDYTSGDPITTSVTMNFLRMNDTAL